jgi:hypothetical protein
MNGVSENSPSAAILGEIEDGLCEAPTSGSAMPTAAKSENPAQQDADTLCSIADPLRSLFGEEALAGAGPRAATTRAGQDVQAGASTAKPLHVEVPFYSQFESGHGFVPDNTACAKASKAMARAAGANPEGSDTRIQVAAREDAGGRITVDPGQARVAQGYIDAELAAGRPVVVGVSHWGRHSGNADDITDHFVVVTGKGADEHGQAFYPFNDPATSDASRGADTNSNNRFLVDEKGMMFRAGKTGDDKLVVDKRFEVSMVVRNRVK